MKVTLYARSPCPLCEEAKDELRRLGVSWDEIDIETDDALLLKYAERIPVVEYRGDVLAEGNLREQPLEQLLGVRR